MNRLRKVSDIVQTRENLPLQVQCVVAFVAMLLLVATGCSSSPVQRFFPRECVLEETITKDELVAHLNRNIQGTSSSPGISGWKTDNASVRVSGIPLPLPASIAVSAPNNLRVIVSNPAGGQEVDFGSNNERLWVWTKQQADTVTCRHEDLSMVMHNLQLPVNVDPGWLMEVLGVIPIAGAEYELERPSEHEPILDLVAVTTTATGEHFERVIRVNTCSGRIESYQFRKTDGTVLAKALLDDYKVLSNGSQLPHSVRISVPSSKMQLKLSLGDPDVNPASFSSTNALWQMPRIPNSQLVDLGEMSRRAISSGARPQSNDPREQFAQNIPPLPQSSSASALSRARFEEPGNIEPDSAAGSVRLSAPDPVGNPFQAEAADPENLNSQPIQQPDNSVPVWAQEHTSQKVTAPAANWQPSAYSGGAWQSSSVRHPLGQE